MPGPHRILKALCKIVHHTPALGSRVRVVDHGPALLQQRGASLGQFAILCLAHTHAQSVHDLEQMRACSIGQ